MDDSATKWIRPPAAAGSPAAAMALATIIGIGFYATLAAVAMTPLANYAAPLVRYFAGHPVSIAATALFSIALGTLAAKSISLAKIDASLRSISDADLVGVGYSDDAVDPTDGETDGEPSHDSESLTKPASNSQTERWLDGNDPVHAATKLQMILAGRGDTIRSSRLAIRLGEVLSRTIDRRGTASLSDDLHDLAERDADAAHNSLGLVRIIIWAIPMLGFLGTVIGITQTLGSLDFSNGAAAVDSLKSGLNVAFDTTALGLVLSVVAIFLQFPVERWESRLLEQTDTRVSRLVVSHLPIADDGDDQLAMVADLCRGIQSAVAASLGDQAQMWKSTIQEAQDQWHGTHQRHHDAFIKSFEVTLVPALRGHVAAMAEQSAMGDDRATAITDQMDRLVRAIAPLATTLDPIRQSIDASVKQSAAAATHASNLDGTTATMAAAARVLARAIDDLNRGRQPGTIAIDQAANPLNDRSIGRSNGGDGSVDTLTRRAA